MIYAVFYFLLVSNICLFVYVLFLQFSKLSDQQPLRLVEKKFIVGWSVPNCDINNPQASRSSCLQSLTLRYLV